MSHEYILISTKSNYYPMANAQDKKEPQWYVMRAYKNMKTAESRLSDPNHGLRYFIPKQKVLRTISGKKVLSLEPVIHSLLFVYATQQQIVEFKHNYYYDLQFVTWKSGDQLTYLTVPTAEMNHFIEVCQQTVKEVHFYRISELSETLIKQTKGKKVRVHGGPFDQVEGYFMKISKKRGRQLVVIIPDLLVVSVEVEPEYIQIIE